MDIIGVFQLATQGRKDDVQIISGSTCPCYLETPNVRNPDIVLRLMFLRNEGKTRIMLKRRRKVTNHPSGLACSTQLRYTRLMIFCSFCYVQISVNIVYLGCLMYLPLV